MNTKTYKFFNEQFYDSLGVTKTNWLNKSKEARSKHKPIFSEFLLEFDGFLCKLYSEMFDEQEIENNYDKIKNMLFDIIKFRMIEYDLLFKWTGSASNGHCHWINKLSNIYKILLKLFYMNEVSISNLDTVEFKILNNFAKTMDISEDR